MKKQSKDYFSLLPDNTVLDVVKTDKHGNYLGTKEMTFENWLSFKKQTGFFYRAYQKTFSQFKKSD